MSPNYIPFGLDKMGTLISAQEVKADDPVRCPGCDDALLVHLSDEAGTAVFVHHEVADCDTERRFRRTAKLRVAAALRSAMESATRPVVIERVCTVCSKPWQRPWTPGLGRVVESYVDATGRICDVVLIQGDLSAVVDIRDPDPSVPAKEPPSGVLAWMELGLVDALTSPSHWRPVRDSGRYPRCPTCEAKETAASRPETRWSRLRRIGATTGQPVPDQASPYWAEPYRCYACNGEMLVYSWTGHRWMQDERPPEPVPPTLWHRKSVRAGGSYWANVCPICRALQGENFIYQPGGPLPRRYRGD